MLSVSDAVAVSAQPLRCARETTLVALFSVATAAAIAVHHIRFPHTVALVLVGFALPLGFAHTTNGVVLLLLELQGLRMPWMIRRLNVGGSVDAPDCT